MPVHLTGTCNMDKIKKIADKNKIVIVEDATQAIGSTFNGRHSGSWGAVNDFQRTH